MIGLSAASHQQWEQALLPQPSGWKAPPLKDQADLFVRKEEHISSLQLRRLHKPYAHTLWTPKHITHLPQQSASPAEKWGKSDYSPRSAQCTQAVGSWARTQAASLAAFLALAHLASSSFCFLSHSASNSNSLALSATFSFSIHTSVRGSPWPGAVRVERWDRPYVQGTSQPQSSL